MASEQSSGVARKLGVHRRMVREPIANAVPSPIRRPVGERPKLGPVTEFGDGMLDADRKAPRKQSGGSAINKRTTWHTGYGISQKKRKQIEESFGWLKTIATDAQGAALGGCAQSCADAESAVTRGSIRLSQVRRVHPNR